MTSCIKKLGLKGEQAVVQWLLDRSFFIREVNYTTRFGEADIIAQKNNLVVIVEVKTRTKRHFSLSQLITKSKQQKIIKTAKKYMLIHKLFNHIIRFDVAIVMNNGANFFVEYQENAFVSNSW